MVSTEFEWKIIVAVLGSLGSLVGLYFNNRNTAKRNEIKTQWDKYDKLDEEVKKFSERLSTLEGKHEVFYDDHLRRTDNGTQCRPRKRRKQ